MNKVTVVLTTHNRADTYLCTALEAILNQTFNDFELFIVDNCSKDNTKNVVSGYNDPRIHYIRNETPEFNDEKFIKIFKFGTAEYIIWTHDDDRMEPNFIEEVYKCIDSSKDILMVSTNVSLIDKNGKDLEFSMYDSYDFAENIIYKQYEYIYAYLNDKASPWPLCPTIMYRRNVVNEAISIMKENYKLGLTSDTLLSLIINKFEGNIMILGKKLYKYRVTHNQESNQKSLLFQHARDTIGQFLIENCGDSSPELVEKIIYNWNNMHMCSAINETMNKAIIKKYGEDISEHFDLFINNYKREDISIINIMNFMIKVHYLKNQFPIDKKQYLLWGTGSAASKTKYIIDCMLPNFVCIGYLDSFNNGVKDGLPIYKCDEYNFMQDSYIVIASSVAGHEIYKKLKAYGLTDLEDFTFGASY